MNIGINIPKNKNIIRRIFLNSSRFIKLQKKTNDKQVNFN